MSVEEAQRWIDNFEGKKPASLEVFLEYMGMTEDEFNSKVKDFIVPPFKPNFDDLETGKPAHDMDEWYRENNIKK